MRAENMYFQLNFRVKNKNTFEADGRPDES